MVFSLKHQTGNSRYQYWWLYWCPEKQLLIVPINFFPNSMYTKNSFMFQFHVKTMTYCAVLQFYQRYLHVSISAWLSWLSIIRMCEDFIIITSHRVFFLPKPVNEVRHESLFTINIEWCGLLQLSNSKKVISDWKFSVCPAFHQWC